MRGIDLDAVLQVQEAFEDTVIEGIRPFFAGHSQVGSRNISNKERITSKHQPRIITTAGIRDSNGDMLWTMPWRMHNAQLRHTKHQFIPVLQVFMRILCMRQFMNVYGRTSAPRNLSMPRDVIGV